MRTLSLTAAVFTFAALGWLPATALAIIPPPSTSLSKTCGVDTCGVADAITVTAGTEVTYCYVLQNNSGITLTTHDLFDDQLGLILNGLMSPLPSGVSLTLTQTATITTTTVNVATWTATNLFMTVTAQSELAAGGGAQGIHPVFVASDSCTVFVLGSPTEPDAGPDGCTDGIDNEPDGVTDCGDPDCVGIAPCVSPAPVLGPGGMVVGGLILLSIGASSLLLRRRNQ